MPELEPITREEKLLDGQDLEPITRKEMFIKRIYDKTQVVPKPITREEMFLNKAGEGGGGDITIEQLNVTQNGTYSESGKAYSPVVVNVPAPPIPENAYLLNDLSGLPANIASFTDGTDLPMASLKVAVTPYQDLHGYDAPWAGGAGKNKLPNSSTDSKSVNSIQINNDKNGKYTISGTATANTFIDFDLDDSYVIKSGDYLHFMNSATNSSASFTLMDGSTLGFSAVFSSTNRIADLSNYVGSTVNKIRFYFTANQGMTGTMTPMIVNSNIATTFAPYSNICPIIGWDEAVVTVADDVDNPTVEHEYTIDLNGTRYGGTLDATDGTFLDMIDHIASYNGEELPPAWISDRDVYAVGTTPTIGAEVVYPRATPITVQLAPQPVKSLEGVNNINANCGQITEVKYFKKA